MRRTARGGLRIALLTLSDASGEEIADRTEGRVLRTDQAAGAGVAACSGVDDRDRPEVVTERRRDIVNKGGSAPVVVVNALRLTGGPAMPARRPPGKKAT
jgi:hypothetical protein